MEKQTNKRWSTDSKCVWHQSRYFHENNNNVVNKNMLLHLSAFYIHDEHARINDAFVLSKPFKAYEINITFHFRVQSHTHREKFFLFIKLSIITWHCIAFVSLHENLLRRVRNSSWSNNIVLIMKVFLNCII